MAAPIALFASCSETKADDLIRGILQDQSVEGSPVIEDIVSYPWMIDTRYYTAKVDLCSTKYRTIGNAEFAKNLEAFIVHFNSKEKASLENVKLWVPYLKEIEPDIRILVCNTCSSGDAVSREDAWKWCLDNAFELVELAPEVEEHSDEEDDFKETTGIKRIIQALHAHSWPNLVMKDKPSFRSSLMTQLMRDQAIENQADCNDDIVDSEPVEQNGDNCDINTTNKTLENNDKCDISDLQNPFLDHLIPNNELGTDSITDNAEGFTDNFNPDWSKLETLELSDVKESKDKLNAASKCESMASKNQGNGASNVSSQKPECDEKKPVEEDSVLETMLASLGSDNGDPEAFEDLFDKLKTMKEQSEHLPFDQRKQYAEKVAVQFWKAIGGDEDEIEGLSSDED